MTDKQITRIYVVKQGDKERLVRAASGMQAIRHCTRPMFKAEVAAPDELVRLTLAGVKVEEVKAE